MEESAGIVMNCSEKVTAWLISEQFQIYRIGSRIWTSGIGSGYVLSFASGTIQVVVVVQAALNCGCLDIEFVLLVKLFLLLLHEL